ncbi:MAG TPA: tRNA (adenosine(37)-N6)-dimethylallyltransferase MiaA [Thermomicrobiales bacterium]|nr:tRNA (adenosine(37)-N6)-dimethylallyltransferase MiaA [Thermomicrobiales bacterium]
MPVPFYVHASMTDQRDLHPDRAESGKPPLIVIVGPTAVGKTRLSLMLAEQFNGEIVNADSRSFYRGMDIGTAKVSLEERERVPHHLIDILDPNDSVSLALFQDMAYASVRDITVRGKTSFLVGGTPQYVNAVVEGWNIPRVEPDSDFRLLLEREAAEHGFENLLERLRVVDPESAIRTGSNVRRIIRALEVYEKTGRPMSEQQSKGPAPFRALELGLWRPREDLHRRIDERVHSQIAEGLFDEIRSLLSQGVSPESAAFTSIGYRQGMPYIRGEATADEVAERIRLDTRRLVRHQETWWRKNPRLLRIDLTQPDETTRVQRAVAVHLGDEGGS